MRKNFTREPANPRERFASSARLPAASVSCAIPYAALVRSDDCARTRPDRSTIDDRRWHLLNRESRESPPGHDRVLLSISR